MLIARNVVDRWANAGNLRHAHGLGLGQAWREGTTAAVLSALACWAEATVYFWRREHGMRLRIRLRDGEVALFMRMVETLGVGGLGLRPQVSSLMVLALSCLPFPCMIFEMNNSLVRIQ